MLFLFLQKKKFQKQKLNKHIIMFVINVLGRFLRPIDSIKFHKENAKSDIILT